MVLRTSLLLSVASHQSLPQSEISTSNLKKNWPDWFRNFRSNISSRTWPCSCTWGRSTASAPLRGQRRWRRCRRQTSCRRREADRDASFGASTTPSPTLTSQPSMPGKKKRMRFIAWQTFSIRLLTSCKARFISAVKFIDRQAIVMINLCFFYSSKTLTFQEFVQLKKAIQLKILFGHHHH